MLVDLATGEIVNTASALNAQVRLGDNVLTRIQHCITHKKMIGRLQLSVAARTLRPLIEQLLLETGIAPGQIRSLVIAGNTTMLHLFAGIDPSSMGMAPFTPQFLEHRVLRASELPLRVRPRAAQAASQTDPPRPSPANRGARAAKAARTPLLSACPTLPRSPPRPPDAIRPSTCCPAPPPMSARM